MNRKRILAMTFLTIVLSVCQDAVAAQPPLRIEKVSVKPKTVDLSKAEKAALTFETTRDAFLTITLRDENANVLNRFELGLKPKGKQIFEWDGSSSPNSSTDLSPPPALLGEDGRGVRTDVVLYTIDARTEDSQYAAYDPAPETGGVDLKFPKFSLDKKTGRIEFILPQAARVRLRAGLVEGALLNTLFDWIAQEAGAHEFHWDGLDKSGQVNFLKHPELNLNLNAFSLPDNSIIIKINEVNYAPPDSVFQGVREGKHFHYPHLRILCHEPRFEIVFPEATSRVIASPRPHSGRSPEIGRAHV